MTLLLLSAMRGSSYAPRSAVYPYPLTSATGQSIKLTVPVNAAGELSDTNDALEILPSTYTGYNSANTPLEALSSIAYNGVTYFERFPTYYRFKSPDLGAYTATAVHARCEFRHQKNYAAGTTMRARATFTSEYSAARSKNICFQIHRGNLDPTFKGVINRGSGSTWDYRVLVKKTDGGADESFNIGLGAERLLAGMSNLERITIEVEWNMAAQTLKFWAAKGDTVDATGTPTHLFTGVLDNGTTSYWKPAGVYTSDVGDGTRTELFINRSYGFTVVT